MIDFNLLVKKMFNELKPSLSWEPSMLLSYLLKEKEITIDNLDLSRIDLDSIEELMRQVYDGEIEVSNHQSFDIFNSLASMKSVSNSKVLL